MSSFLRRNPALLLRERSFGKNLDFVPHTPHSTIKKEIKKPSKRRNSRKFNFENGIERTARFHDMVFPWDPATSRLGMLTRAAEGKCPFQYWEQRSRSRGAAEAARPRFSRPGDPRTTRGSRLIQSHAPEATARLQAAGGDKPAVRSAGAAGPQRLAAALRAPLPAARALSQPQVGLQPPPPPLTCPWRRPRLGSARLSLPAAASAGPRPGRTRALPPAPPMRGERPGPRCSVRARPPPGVTNTAPCPSVGVAGCLGAQKRAYQRRSVFRT